MNVCSDNILSMLLLACISKHFYIKYGTFNIFEHLAVESFFLQVVKKLNY